MDARMPEEFYESISEFLPEEQEPGPQGRRRTTRHRTVLKVIWFVLVTGFPAVGGKPGRPKELPDTLYADAGYDSEPKRCVLRFLGIEPHIRRRNSPHGSHLSKIRWVVERAIIRDRIWFTTVLRLQATADDSNLFTELLWLRLRDSAKLHALFGR